MNPNNLTVSIETEDGYISGVQQPMDVTEEQYTFVLNICKYVLQVYPSVAYLLRHADISPHSRVNCPGDRWIGSGLFQTLADELGLETFL
jgi:N-acetyl-anhydromuramyl-L-alanine amidase AmpD